MPTFPLHHDEEEETKVAEKEEQGMKQEVLWEAEWSDDEEEGGDDEHDFRRGARTTRQPPTRNHEQHQQQGGGGMCLVGQYLLGTLFAGLCGFFTKRIIFREAAGGGAVDYSFLLLTLDGLMGLVAGLAVLGAISSFSSVSSSSSSSTFSFPTSHLQRSGYAAVSSHPTSSYPSSIPSPSPSSSNPRRRVLHHALVLFNSIQASTTAGFLLLHLRKAIAPSLSLYLFLHKKNKEAGGGGGGDDVLSPSWLLLQAGLATTAAVWTSKWLTTSVRGEEMLDRVVGWWDARRGGGGGNVMVGGEQRLEMQRMEIKV